MNQRHLSFICIELHLGLPHGSATSVDGCRGGNLLWKIHTEKGMYAIKQLSPMMDLNNKRMVEKYELSETIAYQFAQQRILAVFAIEKSGKHLVIIENTGYLVYPWIDGYTLDRDEVSEVHALKMAETIARLHVITQPI